MAYKKYYIGVGTLLTIFLALQLYGLQIKSTSPDVIYCQTSCNSTFEVINPTANTIYIYNKNNIKIDFSPKIKDYELYVLYYGKWKLIDFTNKTKLVPSATYVFSFPRYSIRKFKLVGHKENWKDVKWSFGVKNELLDPNWISGTQIGNYIVKEPCVPVYSDISYHKTCEKCYNKTLNSPIWVKNSKLELNGTYTYTSQICYNISCIDYVQNKQTDCNPIGIVNISGEIISEEDVWCELRGNEIVCIHNKEGGRWNECKDDGSVTCCKYNLITKEIKCYNSMPDGLMPKIEEKIKVIK